MADHKHPGRNNMRLTRGQALVEYVLIVTLVSLAIIVILAATGPAIGNVFSNTVYNLLNQTQTPRDTLNAQEIVNYSTAYASYTPPAIVVASNTPAGVDPNAEKPPRCNATALSMQIPPDTVLHRPPRGVLAYCTDPNPGDIPNLIVLSHTQPTAGTGSVTVDLATGEFTYDPQGFLGPYASFTYVVSDQRGGTANGLVTIGINTSSPPPATNTPTPQPPATPQDIQFPYPFYDRGDVPTNWQSGFPNVLYGPWAIEYFNNTDFSGSPVAVGSAFWKNGVETLNYNWDVNPPVAGVTVPVFSIRYRAANVSIESRAYQIMLSASGEAELFIDGTSYVAANNEVRVIDYNATGSLPHDVELRFKHTAPGPASLRLDFNKLADKLQKADLAVSPDCKWATWGSSYHSEYNAWQDSGPSGNYVADTVCNLRLRGFIPIPSAPAKPQLSFWDHWDTSTLDQLVVGVRDYSSTNAWTWVTVHPAGAKNLNWRREAYDLTDFRDPVTNPIPNTGVDFRGKSIELAFKVISDDGNVADGWYIDDIAVDENIVKLYTVGFYDDSENSQISPQNWRNECNWQRTIYDKHGGNYSWASNPPTTQNPSAKYSNSDDCALVLNGLVDLTSYPASGPAQPELSFWSKAILTTATDLVAVEWAPENSDVWTAFTPKGNTDPFVAQATADTTWHEVVVSLNAQREQKFQLRLRLLADGDFNVAQGWYVDDIVLREHSITTVGVPFLEPFDNLDRWQVGGTWGLTTGTDPVHYGAPTALTDSPAGSYPATINTSAELIPSIDLAGTGHPVLSFWTYWNADANLYVDISKDEGVTWETPVWQKITGAGFEGITTQLAWQRIKIDLTPYKDAGPTQAGTVRVRFRLVSAAGTPMDGWYIDELAVQEDDFSAVKVSNGTYLDNIEDAASANNWLPGGTWQITGGQGKDASQGWADSSANYPKPERSELEFKQAIDLSDTTKPTLYFWMKNALGDPADHLYVDVSKDNGFTWLTSAPLWVNPDPEQTNLGWHRIAVDLTSLKPVSASDLPIRLRFRLEATNANTSADGWYIDNFTLFDRANLANLPSPFDDSFNDFANWVVEGDWTDVPNMYSGWTYQPTSLIPTPKLYTSGAQTLTTSNWVGDYWHVDPSHTEVWGASGVTWPDGAPAIPPDIKLDNSPGEINFDYSISPTLPFAAGVPQWIEGTTSNAEYYLMRWQRQYQTASAGTYLMRLRFAGGARLYINNVLQTPSTTLGKPYQLGGTINSNPFIVDSRLRSYWYEVPLSGTNTIKIEYFHTDSTSGPGMIEFAVSEKSTVARTSPGTGNTDVYPIKYKTSLMLDGLLTIPAGKVGLVGYKERYSFTDNGSGRVYYSLDEGLTWTEVTTVRRNPNNPPGDPGSMQDWVNTSFYITDGGATFSAATQVMLKFELFSLAATVGDEGWYIDNFSFNGTDLIANTAPTSSNATFLGVTSTADLPMNFCVTPTVVDNGGDSWTFTPVSSVRGTAWQQGNQLCFSPTNEWTGSTSFLYTVTDSSGASMVGNATATVEISPYFFKGVNANGPTINILGNTWDAWATSGYQTNTVSGSNSTLALDGSPDASVSTMLRTWRGYDGSGTMRVGITGLDDPGIYSVYVWAIESDPTPNAFDIYLNGTSRMRPVNDYDSGSQGHWSRLGPFTMINPGAQLDIYPPSTTSKIAGIEVWRGGTTDWTSADIGFATGVGYGSTTINSDTSMTITSLGTGSSNISGTSDQFRYVFKAETGDLDVIARVSWPAGTSNAKAGLMLRATDANNSIMASALLSYGSVYYFRYRDTTGGAATTYNPSGSKPRWFKLSKVGDTITVYQSSNGASWAMVGSPATISFPNDQFLVGFAIAGYAGSATANIDNFSILQK